MKRSFLFLWVFVLPVCAQLSAQDLVVTPDHADGVYAVGDNVKWTIAYKAASATAPAAPAEVKYTIKAGGLKVIKDGTVALTDGKTELESKFEAPGTLLVTVSAAGDDKAKKFLGGAVAAPDKIDRSTPRPDDFDAFWQQQIDALAKIPANPKLEAADGGKEGVDYFKITMDNINGSKIQGQLARPKKEGKRPAMLVVQYAGVYPLKKPWAVDRAAEGWLVLNIIAHDLPIDEADKFYADQTAGALKNYPQIGNDDREKSYFLRMYLSCYRAAEYLTTREDWDGKTLVVTGASQGGLQAVMTAGIFPKVTGVMADVPAGCDLTGPVVDRACGWPNWYNNVQGKDAEKVRSTGRYFDVMNFASRVKCPVLVGVGMIDTTCPPEGVMAMFNQLGGPKELVIMPDQGHQGNHKLYYGRMGPWQSAMLKGKEPPVNATTQLTAPKG